MITQRDVAGVSDELLEAFAETIGEVVRTAEAAGDDSRRFFDALRGELLDLLSERRSALRWAERELSDHDPDGSP